MFKQEREFIPAAPSMLLLAISFFCTTLQMFGRLLRRKSSLVKELQPSHSSYMMPTKDWF